jgi:heme-degrading monooxygenase HmoA
VPAAKERQGFKGLFLLTNSDTGKGIALTLWETEEDLKASEESGYYQEQLGKLAEVLAEQPEKEDYEVSIQV